MKGETFIITIVSSSLTHPPTTTPLHPPTQLLTAQMSCLFSTPELSLTLLTLSSSLSLSPIPALQIPPRAHTSPPLPICSSPVSSFPLSGLTLSTEGEGGEGKSGGRRDRGRRREMGRPLAVRESAPGWAGFLDTL